MEEKEIETFYPATKEDWRQWLIKNHKTKQSIWLMYYKKRTNKPSIVWSDAVDEALCFGWIDSTARTIDEERYIQYFTKRKATSVWSKINKEKVARLIATGMMAEAGMKTIEIAKQNGKWEILDEVEELVVPIELEHKLKSNPIAEEFFMGLSKSVKKSILQWLMLAKRPETKQKRMDEIVDLAGQKLKPKQFR
ncbi:MAG: YdeI/OmpD-associated family protein [Bacteroidetes bacterium]|nr:YdeI/OmpD-associated family protein [Bacteroidota bacterium]